MMAFYGTLVGEAPYPSLSIAVLESQIPGGHAPGYVAIINQPLPTSPFVWRDDPASFDDFPDFFLAHELAHQWWGQAVGWQNYHEQWLSEGFAQYFAALFAERRRGPGVFGDIVRQLTRWTLAESDQGPVYLGYAARPPARRRPGVPRAGLQQGRRRAAHAAAPAGRRGLLRGRPPVLPRVQVPQGQHRRPAPRARGRVGPLARDVLRAAGSTARTCRRRRSRGR